MAEQDDAWFDAGAAARPDRPYMLTGGRTRPTRGQQLDLATQVVTVRSVLDGPGFVPEHRQIVERCQQPLSVAEIAAYLDIPLAVANVLVSDLIDYGAVVVGPSPWEPSPWDAAGTPDLDVLQAVLDGIRAL